MSLRPVVLMGFSWLALMPGLTAQTPPPPDLNVTVTGYLLGYYRVPDIQPENYLKDCREPVPNTKPFDREEDIWKTASLSANDLYHQGLPFKRDTERRIVLGMGANFGVELYSRTYGRSASDLHPKERDPGPHVGEDGKPLKQSGQWPEMVDPWMIGDNVGCFLSLAHYDVIVPGMEDFYFGPERLRRIAQRLAAVDESRDAKFHPVRMLAANLIEQTSHAKDLKKIPDGELGLKFATGVPKDVEVAEINDNSTVLPFLREINVKVKGHTSYDMNLCAVNAADDREPCAHKQQNLATDLVSGRYPLPKLYAGNNYRLCFEKMKTSGEKPSCIRFTVARPYLLSGKCAKDNRGTSNNCTEFEQPYFRPAGQNVVVFGIVDEDLPILIGRDNRSWRNEHAKFKTELTALEPALALEQAWQCFVKTENLDADKLKTFRKVLLAQMPREKAEELASHVDIDFDLVITAPTRDLAHASSTGHLTIEPLPNEDSPREDQRPQCPRCPTYRSVVIVPMGGQERSSSDCRQDQDTTIDPVQEITVSDALSSHSPWEPVRKVRIAATRRSFSSKPHEAACLREDLDGLAKPDVVLPSGENQYFITRVLKILREKTNTDAALMQKRDFYWGPFLKYQDPNKTPVSPPNAEKIDRVLWKGDVLNVLIVKGSALRKALKESQEFDHLDKQSTKRVDEPFRGLLYFGIAPTDDDDYLIDGTLLDDDRLYTIATTNHIASGDTGYPELNDPELADTRLHNPQKTEKIGQQISKLVCEALKQDHCIAAPPDAPIGSNALFASADARPAQETPNSAVRLKDWFRTSLNEPLISYEPRISQQHVQDRRTWTLALDSASVGYKLVTNNLSEADHQTFLGGITEPGVSAPNSRSWTFTTQARLLDAGKWIDAYIRHQSEYSNQVTQQKQGLPISTYDKNRSVLDAGLFIHPFHVGNHFWSLFSPGGRKSEPKSGFVLEPLRWDSPIRTENLVITHPDKTQEILPLQYTWRLFMRAGLRFENTKSHLEAGTEAGWTHGALLGIHTATGVTCFPNPAQSVQGCLNGLTPPLDPIHQDRTLKTEHGLYIDWNWSEKIWYGWKMIFQDQGEWFPFNASKDNSADTRYRNNLIYKLSLPIFANFSFQPGIEYFSYENKFGDRTLSRWTPTASLDYSFDHHSGGKWKKSLVHKPGGSDSSSGKQ